MEYFSKDDLREVERIATKIDQTLFDKENGISEPQKNTLCKILLSCQDIITGMKVVNANDYGPHESKVKDPAPLPHRYKL